MEYVVDVQGFKSINNNFIFKEVAVIALEEDAVPSVFLFKPPFSWKDLPSKYKSNNRWLEYNKLGIRWSDGDVPYDELADTLHNLLQDARNIYVKGLEKKKWLEQIVSNVFNLEDQECPSLKKMRENIFTLCSHHRLCWKPLCAVQNVYALKMWMFEERKRRRLMFSNDDDDDDDDTIDEVDNNVNLLSMYN